MTIFCCIFGIILCILALIGAILPGLPGPQLAYIAILLAQFLMDKPFSWEFVIAWGIIMILLIILDYYLPILGTKKLGGSKRGNRGCIIGVIVGLFAGPMGLIIGPFLGALVGEYLHQHNIHKSIKPAFGAFIGFISGIVLKLIASIILCIYFFIGCYNYCSIPLNSVSVGTDVFTSLP